MAIWFELGIFVVALAFGWWQLNDVKKARAASQARREREQQAGGGAGDEPRR